MGTGDRLWPFSHAGLWMPTCRTNSTGIQWRVHTQSPSYSEAFAFEVTHLRAPHSVYTVFHPIVDLAGFLTVCLRTSSLQLSHYRMTIFTTNYLYSRSMTLSHWNSLDSEFIRQSKMLLSVMEKYSTITVSQLLHKESELQI